MASMRIVIPGALPPFPVAAELAKLLPQRAPRLHAWLQTASAQLTAFDPIDAGCTAFEAWQLERSGFLPKPGQVLSAGLGPLLAGTDSQDSQPVWLAELVHLALGTDQASLLDPQQMDLRNEESEALLASARPWIDEAGFKVEPLCAQRWRLFPPEGLSPVCASPALVAGQRLNAWWNQDLASRPWRRLLNDIQMAWHEHPVNEARMARGVAPVNALWLYGGAQAWPQPTPSADEVLTHLDQACRQEDWAAWLDALAELDATSIKALCGPDGLPVQATELLLLGRERRATLTLKPRRGWLGWLPTRTKNWSLWWSHPA